MYSDQPFSTFLPMFLRCISITKGPVLELGGGNFSTPILNFYSKIDKRLCITSENDKSWLEKLSEKYPKHKYHRYNFIKDWESYKLIDEGTWDIVLVDHCPRDRRGPDLERARLNNNVRYAIVHDAEDENHFGEYFKSWKYIYIDKVIAPWTAVLSNIHHFNNW
jgi:hypothetical protein